MKMIDANKLMMELYNESENYRVLASETANPYYNAVAISLSWQLLGQFKIHCRGK